jgi:hypothetical protein
LSYAVAGDEARQNGGGGRRETQKGTGSAEQETLGSLSILWLASFAPDQGSIELMALQLAVGTFGIRCI